jgi:hypothetical protein
LNLLKMKSPTAAAVGLFVALRPGLDYLAGQGG